MTRRLLTDTYTGDVALLEDFLAARRHLGISWTSKRLWWSLGMFTRYTVTGPADVIGRLECDLAQWHEDRALLDGRGGF